MPHQPLTIVITMAGVGSRFREAGYTVPKYQIEAHGHTLFEWSMLSLKGYQLLSPHYIFIVRKEDQASTFIKDKCNLLGIEKFDVVELEHRTDGQATTAMLAEPYWDKSSALLIYNIDTYVEAGELNALQLCGDGVIPCFRGEGSHWSFVKLGDDEKAVEVREKCRISENCSIGAYYFKSCELYMHLYEEYYTSDRHSEQGEKFVAPLYNCLIAQGGSVYISNINLDAVHVLGTPEELEVFLGQTITEKQ